MGLTLAVVGGKQQRQHLNQSTTAAWREGLQERQHPGGHEQTPCIDRSIDPDDGSNRTVVGTQHLNQTTNNPNRTKNAATQCNTLTAFRPLAIALPAPLALSLANTSCGSPFRASSSARERETPLPPSGSSSNIFTNNACRTRRQENSTNISTRQGKVRQGGQRHGRRTVKIK